MENKVSKA